MPLIEKTLVSYLVETYAKKQFKGNFHYEALQKEDAAWVFLNPGVLGSRTGVDFQADKIYLDYTFNLLSWQLDVSVDLKKPVIHLSQYQDPLKSRIPLNRRSYQFIPIKHHIMIDGGIFINEMEESETFPFDLELMTTAKSVEKVELRFTPELEQNALSIAKENGGYQLNFDHVDFQKVHNLLKLLDPSLRNFIIKQGTLSGRAYLVFADPFPTLKGHLTIEKLLLFQDSLHGRFEKVELFFEEQNSKTLGKVHFEGPALVENHFRDQLIWQFQFQQGNFALNQNLFSIGLQGLLHQDGQALNTQILGQGSYTNRSAFNLTSQLIFEHPDEKKAFVDFTHLATAQFSRLSFASSLLHPEEGRFFSSFFFSSYPRLASLKWTSGEVKIGGDLVWNDEKMLSCQLQQFHLTEFEGSDDQMQFKLLELKGRLEFGAINLWETLSGELSLQDSNLIFKEEYTGLDFPVEKVKGSLFLQKGKFMSSYVEGTLNGLSAFATLDSARIHPLELSVEGNLQGFSSFARSLNRPCLADEIRNQNIALELRSTRSQTEDFLEGQLAFEATQASCAIPFKILLKKSPSVKERPLIEAFNYKLLSLRKNCGPLESVMNFLGYETWKGTLEGKEISLNEMIAPFLMTDRSIKLEGRADFKGEFDSQGMGIQYFAKEVNLNSRDFQIDLKDISQDDHQIASHYIDFKNGQHEGTFFIQHGTYFEKNSGLLFTDIDSQVNIKNKVITLPLVETYSNGIYFAGSLGLDLSSPEKGFFNLLIHLQMVHGKASQVQGMLSHFKKTLAEFPFPLEGDVSLRENSLVQFNFAPEDYTVRAQIKGEMNDGWMPCGHFNMKMQDLSSKFDYDHEAKLLHVSDIQGTVLVGKQKQFEEYILAGDYLRFTDCTANQAEFDIWVGDKNRDILRLVGHTVPDQNQEDNINVIFDQKISHFGDIHPDQFGLILKNWCRIENLDLNFNFDLTTLLPDLKKVFRIAAFPMPLFFEKQGFHLEDAAGKFRVNFTYDQDRSSLAYRLEGQEITLFGRSFAHFIIRGTALHQRWEIEELSLDDIALTGEILRKSQSWKINHLGLKWSDLILFGMDGEFFEENLSMKSKIQLMNVDLAHLNKWHFLKDWIKPHDLRGLVKASGEVNFDFPKGMHGGDYQGELLIDVSGLEVDQFKFEDIHQAKLTLSSDEGLTLYGCPTKICNVNGCQTQLDFDIAKMGYSIREDLFSLGNVSFKIPLKSWEVLLSQENQGFSGLFGTQLWAFFEHLQPQNAFLGTFNFDKSGHYAALNLHLNEGLYTYKGGSHLIPHFELEVDPFDLKIMMDYQYKDHIYETIILSKVPQYSAGEALIHLKSLPSKPGEEGIKVKWKIEPSRGIVLEKVQGSFPGLNLDLLDQKSDIGFHQWIGKAMIDFSKLRPFLGPDYQKMIERLQLGRGFSIDGHFRLDKEILSEEGLLLSTSGILSGYQFQLKGFTFGNLMGQIETAANRIKLSEIKLEDRALKLYIQNLEVYEGKFILPTLLINQLRPSLLQVHDHVGQYPKTLVIPSLEVDHLQGDLSDLATWEGKGQLSFTNYKKKNLQNILFAIPTEILSHLGLDLSLLNPVTGTILFEFKEGKVFLRKFVDMYSEGKLSKFNLLDDEHSFVSWEGGLNIQLRLKQSNMLLKIGEMFHFSILGDFKKPTYNVLRPSERQRHHGKNLQK